MFFSLQLCYGVGSENGEIPMLENHLNLENLAVDWGMFGYSQWGIGNLPPSEMGKIVENGVICESSIFRNIFPKIVKNSNFLLNFHRKFSPVILSFRRKFSPVILSFRPNSRKSNAGFYTVLKIG